MCMPKCMHSKLLERGSPGHACMVPSSNPVCLALAGGTCVQAVAHKSARVHAKGEVGKRKTKAKWLACTHTECFHSVKGLVHCNPPRSQQGPYCLLPEHGASTSTHLPWSRLMQVHSPMLRSGYSGWLILDGRGCRNVLSDRHRWLHVGPPEQQHESVELAKVERCPCPAQLASKHTSRLQTFKPAWTSKGATLGAKLLLIIKPALTCIFRLICHHGSLQPKVDHRSSDCTKLRCVSQSSMHLWWPQSYHALDD